MFAPVSLTREVRETVDSLGGNVKYIAALDMEHHLHLTSWKNAYPSAEIIAPEGLWEKRQRQSNREFRDTEFTHIFTKEKAQEGQQGVSEEFDAEFEIEYMHGHPSRELVFFHKPSRSLIEADLLFNLPANEQYSRAEEGPSSSLTKLVKPFMSTVPPATMQRRFAWYVLAKDRAAFNKSVARIDQWGFQRLIPCHGDVVEDGAKGVFRTVMEWALAANELDGASK